MSVIINYFLFCLDISNIFRTFVCDKQSYKIPFKQLKHNTHHEQSTHIRPYGTGLSLFPSNLSAPCLATPAGLDDISPHAHA